MVKYNDERGPLHALYVACSHVISSGGRTSTLGTLIIPLDVYAAKRRYAQWYPRLRHLRHPSLVIFLRIALEVVTIVEGLSQYPIRCRMAGTMLHGTKKLKNLPWRPSLTYLFVNCCHIDDDYLHEEHS
ncbi:hypothetical protein AUEXF2481DRAFT_306876 [Aureobasidium subglaciale EXF-2481]|uniref:Uncharacterized protein n=1 Tax=Aureobasidium subglaciale (strain EXF-2481) TaxID=1043005 RepID=A0A074Y7P7_AURSE|nr:uncharacterized protein AUEXF2481DRAFT_306876 [Aureobasidium subglaciale EXF-2481]KEQ93808.1 hypothetical protein AUEXF2481DRAFT_306876 [Aureobasidium subglaciale EXF-2481]